MAQSKGIAIGIIAFIVGAGGLGIGIYSIFAPEKSSEVNLVAVWEDLEGFGDNFYLNISNNQLPQNDYFSMTDETNITLTQQGWYKFTIRTTWTSLVPTDNYYMTVVKNSTVDAYLMYLNYPQESTWSMNINYYVYSDGDDSIRFHCYTLGADSVSIAINQGYNQMILEYIVDM